MVFRVFSLGPRSPGCNVSSSTDVPCRRVPGVWKGGVAPRADGCPRRLLRATAAVVAVKAAFHSDGSSHRGEGLLGKKHGVPPCRLQLPPLTTQTAKLLSTQVHQHTFTHRALRSSTASCCYLFTNTHSLPQTLIRPWQGAAVNSFLPFLAPEYRS